MYLNSSDYQTIWRLAHDWAGKDSHASDPNNISPEIMEAVYRVLVAIRNKLITVRTSFRVLFEDEGFLDFMFEARHYKKFGACLKNNRFDKDYLDSLYVWRPEVIRWCVNDQLPIPSVWLPKLGTDSSAETDADDGHWYEGLTDRRKRIVAALHIAARLWEEDKSFTYEDVWNHPDMKKYDKPRIFPSLESFKEWARDIAPPEAKAGGRRKYSV